MNDCSFVKLVQHGNVYSIDRSKSVKFSCDRLLMSAFVDKSADFAYKMAFGSLHREHRSGGSEYRNKLNVFFNAFLGKLGEYGLYQRCMYKSPFICSEPDVAIYERGRWDTGDLILTRRLDGFQFSVSVKSAKHFSNLLLLETQDWDKDGYYIPDKVFGNPKAGYYDMFVLVRVGSRQFDYKDWCIDNRFGQISDLLLKLKNDCMIVDWYYDVPGFISHSDLVHIIRNGFILPKDSLLNGRMKMDASNYYVQAGDLKKFIA